MTATDRQILEAIRDLTDRYGYPPTLREICKATGLFSAGSLKYRVDTMRDKGLLTYEAGKSRTIKLTERGEQECL